ncbi:MAG: hypothetical protein ABIQ75_10705 [Flavobacteriales bacterium]
MLLRHSLPDVRAITLMLAMALPAIGMSQGRFVINGKLKVEGGGLDGCKMVVYRDGEKHKTISTDLNKFSLELELNKTYVLSFEKPGFVTKKLSFNTNAPAAAALTGFTPFDFVVSLFKQYDGMNTVVFNQPVGMIRYDERLADFEYDTDYTKSIQSALEAAQAEVTKKQQEEERQLADEAKRKEQEEKDKAKADAKAQKDAAAKAKDDAKAQAKQEAATREAEQARLAEAKPVPKVEPKPEPKPVPPPVVAPVAETPAPKAPKPRPAAVATTISKPRESSEARNASVPRIAEERSPIQPALAHASEEPRPKFEATPIFTVRHQDVIVEPNQVVTVVRLERGATQTEYRKVIRKYSGTFYFKDGSSCTRSIYESEALAEVQ